MKSGNLYSLLNTNWMFAGNSESSLYPFLFNIINGTQQTTAKLSPTTYQFVSDSGGISNSATENSNGNVAVVKMHHPIFKYNQECGPRGTQSIMKQMDAWKNDNAIKGVLLDIHSGGGQASGCSEFAEYLHNYPKPTGTYTNDVVGSAAYYAASATGFITANKHADFIGCIGSMMKKVDMEGVLIKRGASIEEFYSDLSPEKNLQSRALKNGDSKPLITKFLNPLAKTFIDDVKLYRPGISEKALQGDVFNPDESLQEGLIDEIGTFQSAIDKILSMVTTNKNNSNQNTITMSNLKTPLIEAVIGANFSDAKNETGILLTDNQATAIENKLSANDAEVLKFKNEATAAKDELRTLTSDSAAVTNAVQNALKTAEVENAATMTNEAGIIALSNLVAKYGANDGGKGTNPLLNLGGDANVADPVANKLESILKNI
ncbi:S49 family peptidase [Tenacibaculum piscium]|uniref:S49 family peptidase n=1 Tax=Tenacibaculum piscium TaxID=1458515 RepID=UPI0023B88FAC|nr:S49 family peptidase [Tenacibaculum piscium]